MIRWWEIEISESETMLWNEDQLPRVKKETKPTLRGKWESVFSGKHMDNVPKETHAVSVVTLWPLEARVKARDEKGDRLLPHPIRRQNRLTARDENPHRDQAINRKTREIRVKFHADSNSVQIRHVDSGILPCVWITSLKKVVYMATNAIFYMVRQKKAQQKVKERWCARISCDIEGVYTIGLCISRFLSEKDLFYVNLENWDRNSPSNSPKAPGTKSKFGKERVHREVLSKSVRLMSVVLARRNSRTDHMRKLCTKKDAPAKQRGIWRKTFTSSRIRTKLRLRFLVKQR